MAATKKAQLYTNLGAPYQRSHSPEVIETGETFEPTERELERAGRRSYNWVPASGPASHTPPEESADVSPLAAKQQAAAVKKAAAKKKAAAAKKRVAAKKRKAAKGKARRDTARK